MIIIFVVFGEVVVVLYPVIRVLSVQPEDLFERIIVNEPHMPGMITVILKNNDDYAADYVERAFIAPLLLRILYGGKPWMEWGMHFYTKSF